jgi:hypothetical protein
MKPTKNINIATMIYLIILLVLDSRLRGNDDQVGGAAGKALITSF